MVKAALPRWSEYMFVLLAAWLIAGLFVDKVDRKALHSNAVWDNQPSDSLQDNKKNTLFQSVALFGELQQSETPQQEQKVEVVASRLNMKLIGTVVAGDKSAAMLMVQGQKMQQVFFLDEEIQPNVKLISVETTAIVVDNAGKHERISIEAGKGIVSAPTANVRQNKRRPKRLPVNNRRINKQNLQKQMRNFSTLLSQARVTPHFTDKKADGFTISEIVKGSLYEEIGLKNGDIIKKVNGEAVTGAEQAMRMYRELQHATFIDVEIMRGGSTQQISYTIQ